MKKLLSFILITAMILGMCSFGAAYAEWKRPPASGRGADGKAAQEQAEEKEDAAEEPDAYADEAEEPDAGAAEAEETEEPAPLDGPEEAPQRLEEEDAAPGEKDGEFVLEDYFTDWNGDAPALGALTEYVEAVTDEAPRTTSRLPTGSRSST